MPNDVKKMPNRLVVIVAFDGVQAIDFSGPAQAFIAANEEGAQPPYEVRVAAFTPGSIRTASGFSIQAEPIPEDEAIDTLVLPGGPGVHTLLASDAAIKPRLTELCQRTRRVSSVCTGAPARDSLSNIRTCRSSRTSYMSTMGMYGHRLVSRPASISRWH